MGYGINDMRKLIRNLIVVTLIILVGGGLYCYLQKTSSQQNLKEKSDLQIGATTKTSNIIATSTDAKIVVKTSTTTKPKFDLDKPILVSVPGIHGMETVNLTNLKYTKCAASDTRAENHPGSIDLTSKEGLIIQEDKNYYNVNGTNEFQIYNEIYNCTIALYGQDYGADAITENTLNYDFKYDTVKNQVCRIRNIAVGVHISYLLPKWVYLPEATGPLVDIWNTYFERLQKHEEHHGVIAKEYSNKLNLYLQELSSSKTCVSSIEVINNKFDSIIEELNAAQAKYDLEVDHGVKEGVFDSFNNI